MGSTYHQLFYHLVWGTYKRIDLIDEYIEKDLKKLIEDKTIEYKSELLCFGWMPDHIHLLIRLHPAVSVSKIIGEIKGFSLFMIANCMYPESGFRWQRGFGAFTVSRKELSMWH